MTTRNTDGLEKKMNGQTIIDATAGTERELVLL